MTTPSRNQLVTEYLDALDASIAPLFLAVRDDILHAGVELDEAIKWKDCLVYSSSKNLIQTVLGKGKISLIFYEGVAIDDGRGLLEGDGKKARTFRITNSDYDTAALQSYVRAADEVARGMRG
ncbi:MAG: DUF1801 domain-containing protein [Microcella sp.]|uniref:DUF1801 domain-containing protein n=1 Tax=Microcella sp. TaxID=1913979 RepID=UPI003315C4A1